MTDTIFKLDTNCEIDRDCTVTLKVDREGPVRMLEALGRYRTTLFEETACVQQVTRNVFKWSVRHPDLVSQILKETATWPFNVNDNDVEVTVMIIIHKAPYEIKKIKRNKWPQENVL